MPDLIRDGEGNVSKLAQNYRRAFASSNFGTRSLSFYSVYFPILDNAAVRINVSGSTAIISDIGTTHINTNLMTTEFTGDEDDHYTTISIPFDVTFLGNTYSEVSVGSNSYITFGGGSESYDIYNSPTLDGSNLPALVISGEDNSYQKVYSYSTGTTPSREFRIRYEGFNDTEANGPSNIIWEVVFYENLPGIIDLIILSDARGSEGTSGVTNGTEWVDGLPYPHNFPWGRYFGLASNSGYYQVVRAIQQVAELYYVGRPAIVNQFNSESFVIGVSDNNSALNEVEVDPGIIVATKISDAISNAGIENTVIKMTVGAYSIYTPSSV